MSVPWSFSAMRLSLLVVLGLFLLVWAEATVRRRAGEGAGKVVVVPGDGTEYAGPAKQG